MSELMIVSQSKEGDYSYIELTSNKKTASISYSKDLDCINVLCKNAMHKAWRGSGRFFYGGWAEAVAAYKSPDMKIMINHAKEAFCCKESQDIDPFPADNEIIERG